MVVNSLVIGATRAPAVIDGILAVDKRGQMTGGSERARLINILIYEDCASHNPGDVSALRLRLDRDWRSRC